MARDNASLKAVRKMILVDVPANLARDGKAHLIRTARTGIAQITQEQTARAQGIAPAVTAYANSPSNQNLESVRIPGPIVARFDYRREIAVVTLRALIKNSPKENAATGAVGDYASSHTILLNGQKVDTLPANLALTDIITIFNPLPYARRLEIGKTKSGRRFVLQVEDRIYERTMKSEIAPRYRNVATLRFAYIPLPAGFEAQAHQIKGKLASHYTSGTFGPAGKSFQRKRRQQKGTAVRCPAIVITPVER